MPSSSAPGKVYLFGEHAVVYGEPSIPCAIDKRVHVTCATSNDHNIAIDAPQADILNFNAPSIEYSIKSNLATVDPKLHYILVAVDLSLKNSGHSSKGIKLSVKSDIPIGAGIGSSAAVCVATIDAVSRAYGAILSLEQIADLAYSTECIVQGNASRADTFCSTMGGTVHVEGSVCRTISSSELFFAIGYDGGSGPTGELVAMVKSNKEKYPFLDSIIHSIGDLTRIGEIALTNHDISSIGELMNLNHGLLTTLGVSSESLDNMVWASRNSGAIGAKLTGAGGAGCIVALNPTDSTLPALLSTKTCQEAFLAKTSRKGLIRH